MNPGCAMDAGQRGEDLEESIKGRGALVPLKEVREAVARDQIPEQEGSSARREAPEAMDPGEAKAFEAGGGGQFLDEGEGFRLGSAIGEDLEGIGLVVGAILDGPDLAAAATTKAPEGPVTAERRGERVRG